MVEYKSIPGSKGRVRYLQRTLIYPGDIVETIVSDREAKSDLIVVAVCSVRNLRWSNLPS